MFIWNDSPSWNYHKSKVNVWQQLKHMTQQQRYMFVWFSQAAHAVLQLQELGKPVYKVKNVSLNALCEMYDAPVNPMKDQLKNVYRRDQRYWARRPLTRDMMLYAAADVLALVPQVYNAMTRSVNMKKFWSAMDRPFIIPIPQLSFPKRSFLLSRHFIIHEI